MAPRPHHRQGHGRTVMVGDIPGTHIPFPPLPGFPQNLGPGGLGIPDLGTPTIPNPIQPLTDIPSAIGKLGDAVQGITNFFTEWLLNPGRLVKLIGGGILLIMGINAAIKQTTGVDVGGAAKRAGEAAAGAAAAAAA